MKPTCIELLGSAEKCVIKSGFDLSFNWMTKWCKSFKPIDDVNARTAKLHFLHPTPSPILPLAYRSPPW